MAKSRVVLNSRGIRQLLRSDGVSNELKRRADAIAAAAGPGHEVQVSIGRNRARATVRTATWPARYHEATDRTLSRALSAGASGGTVAHRVRGARFTDAERAARAKQRKP